MPDHCETTAWIASGVTVSPASASPPSARSWRSSAFFSSSSLTRRLLSSGMA